MFRVLCGARRIYPEPEVLQCIPVRGNVSVRCCDLIANIFVASRTQQASCGSAYTTRIDRSEEIYVLMKTSYMFPSWLGCLACGPRLLVQPTNIIF